MNTEMMRKLSAIGPGDAMTVFVWMAAADEPVQQAWLEGVTHLSNKSVYLALMKLWTLEYVVQTTDGWSALRESTP